jgi:hypothetical protein
LTFAGETKRIRTRSAPRARWTSAQDSGTVDHLMAAVNPFARGTKNPPAAAGMGAFTAVTLIDQPRAH